MLHPKHNCYKYIPTKNENTNICNHLNGDYEKSNIALFLENCLPCSYQKEWSLTNDIPPNIWQKYVFDLLAHQTIKLLHDSVKI